MSEARMKRLFLLAAIFGILVLAPAVLLERVNGLSLPPAIADFPQIYRLLLGPALAAQFLFLLIAVDPRRFRSLMLIGIVEKSAAVLGIPLLLAAGGAISGPLWAVPVVDGAFGIAFYAAWRAAGR
jgi:hypothetical protein